MSPEEALAWLGRVTGRSPFAYSTTWPIEEVRLTRPNGQQITVLLKRFAGAAGHEKPARLLDRDREAAAYRLLAQAGITTARCHAAGPGWIVVEKLPGVPLWQSGNIDDWCRAARWAAELHACFSSHPPRNERLLRHDRAHYEDIAGRALALAGPASSTLTDVVAHAIERLLVLPPTLIHGELYPSNLILGCDRIAAVDWETAALGPGALDLAALVTGWDPAASRAISGAYGAVDPGDLAAARLLLALQWLSWSRDWRAPPEHRRDWLAEAHAAAEELTCAS